MESQNDKGRMPCRSRTVALTALQGNGRQKPGNPDNNHETTIMNLVERLQKEQLQRPRGARRPGTAPTSPHETPMAAQIRAMPQILPSWKTEWPNGAAPLACHGVDGFHPASSRIELWASIGKAGLPGCGDVRPATGESRGWPKAY